MAGKNLSPKALMRLRRKRKDIMRNLKRRMRNKAVRTRMKNAVKKVKELIRKFSSMESSDTQLEELERAFRLAVKLIDKACSKGVIHKNEASRRKSRLAKLYAKFKVERLKTA